MRSKVVWLVFGLLSASVGSQVSGASSDIAVLVSSETEKFFDAHYPECGDEYPAGTTQANSELLGVREYERYWMGWTHVLGQMSLAFQIIGDDDLTRERLKPFKLLIISNGVNLSDDGQKSIGEWVRGGGNLIATFGTGYKDIVFDPREADLMKLQKGGTGGLHHLWGDPLNKLFGTGVVDFDGVDVRITRSSTGPTQGLSGIFTYAFAGNLLVQRPENARDVFAVLAVDNWTRSQPAILHNTHARGRVVYYAFAPEYIIALRYDLAGHCEVPHDDRYDPKWPGAGWANYYAYMEDNHVSAYGHDYSNWSANLIDLMRATIQFLYPIP